MSVLPFPGQSGRSCLAKTKPTAVACLYVHFPRQKLPGRLCTAHWLNAAWPLSRRVAPSLGLVLWWKELQFWIFNHQFPGFGEHSRRMIHWSEIFHSKVGHWSYFFFFFTKGVRKLQMIQAFQRLIWRLEEGGSRSIPSGLTTKWLLPALELVLVPFLTVLCRETLKEEFRKLVSVSSVWTVSTWHACVQDILDFEWTS